MRRLSSGIANDQEFFSRNSVNLEVFTFPTYPTISDRTLILRNMHVWVGWGGMGKLLRHFAKVSANDCLVLTAEKQQYARIFLGWLDFYSTEWLPHLDQSYDYKNGSHSQAKLFKNLGAEGKPGDYTTSI